MKKNFLERAVFLDRDGVINKEIDHLSDVADFRLLPGVADAIKRIKSRGYRVIVISNQAAVAKGITTLKKVDIVHAAMLHRLSRKGAEIDAVLYCPHHPHGIVKQYAILCNCRKPEIGMIQDGARRYNIDVKKSFLVGDTTRDILTGHKAGMKTILVKTGYGGSDKKHDVVPDFIAKNLLDATKFIPQ